MRGEGGGERASELAGVVYLHSHTRTHTKHTRSHTHRHTHAHADSLQFTVYSYTVWERDSESGRQDDAMRCDGDGKGNGDACKSPRQTRRHTHTANTHTDDTHDAENRWKMLTAHRVTPTHAHTLSQHIDRDCVSQRHGDGHARRTQMHAEVFRTRFFFLFCFASRDFRNR